jgi:ElaB/YqjD/DUF883 family membrane-anchored ribosome-binding protein
VQSYKVKRAFCIKANKLFGESVIFSREEKQMADYKERFDKWQREAKERFEDFDKQLNLKEKIEEGAKVAKEAAKKGAETLKESAQKIKAEAENSEVGKEAARVAEQTAKKAWDASEPLRNIAEDASGKAADIVAVTAVEAEKVMKEVGKQAGAVFNVAAGRAGEVFEDARDSFGTTADRVSRAFNLGASWTRTIDSAIKTVQKTTDWIHEKPLEAAATGVSMAVGAGLGVVFTGVSSHWLFNSALPAWSVQKASEQFQNYLKSQDELIKNGELTQAEAERIAFERDIAKRVGAPLLGAFSFASGAVLMTNVFNPKTLTGFPIDLLLGGNPLLEGVWFFGNGLVCFKTSYDFFMFALEDHEEVQRMVREIKGLLPA